MLKSEEQFLRRRDTHQILVDVGELSWCVKKRI